MDLKNEVGHGMIQYGFIFGLVAIILIAIFAAIEPHLKGVLKIKEDEEKIETIKEREELKKKEAPTNTLTISPPDESSQEEKLPLYETTRNKGPQRGDE